MSDSSPTHARAPVFPARHEVAGGFWQPGNWSSAMAAGPAETPPAMSRSSHHPGLTTASQSLWWCHAMPLLAVTSLVLPVNHPRVLARIWLPAASCWSLGELIKYKETDGEAAAGLCSGDAAARA
jgi:hypothetical protein